MPLNRHGRTLSSALRTGIESQSQSQSQLENLLVVASIAKTLSVSGTRGLDPDCVPLLSEQLVLQLLRRPSLDASKKIDFFKWCSSQRNIYKHSACAYSHIFRTVCRAGYLEQVPGLLDSMKDDGVIVDSGTFKSLLDAFIRSGKFDSAIDILDHMEEMGTSLNPSVYSSVLVALVRKNQLGLALSIFFKLLEASNGASEVEVEVRSGDYSTLLPDALASNELLVALRKANMKLEFKNVFDKLREKKDFGFDTWGYNICIHAFGCWGDLETSLMLFREMKQKSMSSSSGSRSVDPDLCTYNSLIHILCLVGKVKDAIIVWEELKASGHEPDAFTYRIIIQGCCKSYRMDDATKIFSEMQYNGFCPDTVVYNSLLDGLFKARRITEACQLFEKMVQDGIRASCWTHNIIIDGLFRNGRSVAGYSLFCDLKKKGQFVDAVTYSIVVLHLCKEGQLEDALQLVEEMEARGFVVDLVTVTSLLIGIHKQGRWDWSERLMKHIRDGYLVPSVLKWKSDMEASMKNPKRRREDFMPMFPSRGDLSEVMSFINHSDSKKESFPASEDGGAESMNISSYDNDQWSSSPYMDRLANQMKSNNHSHGQFLLYRGRRVQAEGTVSFDIDMVNTYLSIFLAKGKMSLACKLFEIFTDMGVNPVNYTYNAIMSSFVKKGYFNEAWGVLHEMGENTCPADIATYNVIIQGLGKMGKADLASAVLDKLMKEGGYLDIVMYNTLINALGKDGRVDEANKLFEQMRATGINPDVVTYNTLIEVHSKAGQLKDAYRYLKMMLDAGCSPNHVTDTTLDFLGKEIETLRYQKASIVRDNKANGSTIPNELSTSSSKLILYSFWQSSCAWRVRFALNLKGLSYEYKGVNLAKGEHFSPDFEKLNPLHFVPVLVDGDLVVSDSYAILLYLEERYPQKALLPVDTRLRAINLQAASIISSSIQPLHMLSVLKYIEEKVGPQESLSWAQYNIEKGFLAVEKLLKDFAGRYATGEEVYMADAFLAPQISIATARFNIDMSQFPTLSRLYESYKALPEFHASLPERQPDALQ